MKTAAFLVMTMILAGAITGCGSDSATGAAAVPTTPATITGLSTPKSVSVVTAN
jgi:curli biogenesis system outer membrane secretion channel CsgG